ncbi:MAG: hypothetical protein KF887_06950 [Paracoccaceae bacterium]|nr:MAG: hypothetical protein KF887_06950 [Paracoccaceae bacterium]
MTRPDLPSFDTPAAMRPDQVLAMLAALARAHQLQIGRMAEATEDMRTAGLANLDLTFLASEMRGLADEAAVIEAAVRSVAHAMAGGAR